MRAKVGLPLSVLALVVLADQGTKYLAVSRLTDALDRAGRSSLGERLAGYWSLSNLDDDPPAEGGADLRRPPVVVVEGYWKHRYVENPGAAWGLLSGVSERVRRPFFHAVNLVALLAIGTYFRRLKADQTLTALSLSLILGGATGNYLDRVTHGYVVDFIDWHWHDQPGLHWPTFNLADAAIVVGVLLMMAETLFVRRPAGGPAGAPGPGPERPKAYSVVSPERPPEDPLRLASAEGPEGP